MNKFELTEDCTTSFEQLKHLLTNALVLKIADHDKKFVACINAYKESLGGVLMQEGHVFFYE